MHGNGPVLDDEILADPEVQDAIKNEGSVHRNFKILNTDRATFGRVGGAVAKLHGDSGFAGNLSFDLEVGLVTGCLTAFAHRGAAPDLIICRHLGIFVWKDAHCNLRSHSYSVDNGWLSHGASEEHA